MSQTLLTWYEPMFFIPRLRPLNDWLWRLGSSAGIAFAIWLGMVFVGGQTGTKALIPSIGFGLFLTFIRDVLHIQREIWITDDAIHWKAGGGKYWITGAHWLNDIARFECLRPGEWPFQFGGIRAHQHDGKTLLFAVSKGMRLESIAAILTRNKMEVSLSGWEPTTADSRTRVAEELVINQETATRDAVFTPISADEPKLLSFNANVFASGTSAIPLLIALIGMLATWSYLGWNWQQYETTQRVLIGAGGFGILVLGIVYFQLIGQYIKRSLKIPFLEKGIRLRTNPIVDPLDEDLYVVSLYPRESWSKPGFQSADLGFLQFDRRKSALVFEGDKERWSIPKTALTPMRIEEAAVGREGAEKPELRYFVVIGTHRDGANWEIGMIRGRTKWGNDDAKARRARMGQLFSDLQSSMSTT